MSLFEDTNPRALKELLLEIHSRATALPDFQRDFVWEPVATQELIVSIANNYPAGSILRVRDTQRLFAAREFEGAPRLDGYPHTFLVLDGQQRLTSLYQAFYGVGEHRYYLDLKKLLQGEDFEDAILHVRATARWVQAHEQPDVQAAELVLPLSVLKAGAGGFLTWLLSVTNHLPPNERTRLLDDLTRVHERWITTIDDYHFPVVTLSDRTDSAALCTIFETLNRTGVKLGVFELLTARFWPASVRLRDLWAKAQEKHSVIADYEVDPYYVLQAIALACRKAPSCKRSDVLKLEATEVATWWDAVADGLAAGLQILRDDCRVLLPKWLPYQTMLAPLAAALARCPLPQNPVAGARREMLKRWFWCAVLGQAYENAPNTQSAKDYSELVAWFDGAPPPETVGAFRLDPTSLRDITPRQRAAYRGVICLILASGSGARDFHTQSPITGTLLNSEGIDDHHVFPAGFLEARGVTSPRLRDCVLNRTLIDRTTNQMIGHRAPSQYLADIRDVPGFPLGAVLESHCLPAGVDSPLWTNDYESFLGWRQARLWAEIRRVTGLQDSATATIADQPVQEPT